jgi:2-amino-4-hydroxy-6-hydroxymethyldihydropteridine diphosphokinase
MNSVFIILGSNINKERNLPEAVRRLGGLCRVVAVSSVYETLPVGLPDQPNFLNAAVRIETELAAGQVKESILGQIEKQLGRRRTADKNAPRTIDADLVLFNDEVFDYVYDGRRRHIPDPDLLKFPHVATPVAELAPEMLHPETVEPLSAIAQRLLATATTDGKLPLWQRPDISLRLE